MKKNYWDELFRMQQFAGEEAEYKRYGFATEEETLSSALWNRTHGLSNHSDDEWDNY